MPIAASSVSSRSAAAHVPSRVNVPTMQLVNDLALDRDARPRLIAPGKRQRIDHLGGAVWSIGLKSRRRIGIGPIAGIELELVAASHRRLHQAAEVAVGFGIQRDRAAVVEHDVDGPRRGRPHPEMRPAVAQVFRADRITPRRRRVRDRRSGSLGPGVRIEDGCCVPQGWSSYWPGFARTVPIQAGGAGGAGERGSERR